MLLHELGFLELRAKGLGRRFWAEVRKAEETLLRHPEAGREVRAGVRRWQLRKFRYALIYAPLGERILILAVAHNSRRPDYWVDRVADDAGA